MIYADNEKIVLELAIAAYGRVLGITGIKHYSDLLNNKTLSKEDILSEFMSNTEASVRYPANLSTDAIVKLVFQNVLNREPATKEGLKFWTDRFDSGSLNYSSLVNEILNTAKSAEGGDKLQLENKVAIAIVYLNTQEKYPDITILSPDLSLITSEANSLNELENILNAQLISSDVKLSSLTIANGNYSFGGIIDIVVAFDDAIKLTGTDSTLSILLGDTEKKALFSSKTSNSITYKYTVEEGYGSKDIFVSVVENALVLNTSSILDTNNKSIPLNYESFTNELATISDTYAPVYTISNAHYDSKTNNLDIYGEGFSSLLENFENETTDIIERLDFSKITWNIDFNDVLEEPITTVAFNNEMVSLVQVINDNNLNIILIEDNIIESTEGFGQNNGLNLDSIDIREGFLSDSYENISLSSSYTDIVLGIDNNTWGDNSSNIIYGNSNKDTINALDSNDVIYAQAGNDTIDGGRGEDIISGGSGVDTISGGEGNDIFKFAINDSIISFTELIGIDKILDIDLDDGYRDRIDLDIEVTKVNNNASGNVNQSSFTTDINSMFENDFHAAVINVTGGDLKDKDYLVVDYNNNLNFDEDDFALEITGSSFFSSISVDTFI